jgi:hypothetical protein
MLYVIFRVAAVAYNCCMEISLDSNPTELQTESPSEVKPFLVKTKSDEKPRRTAAEVQSIIERRSLELAKAKVVRELESAQSPRYQEMLNHALQELNAKLSRLG